jgi:hypothetical protein
MSKTLVGHSPLHTEMIEIKALRTFITIYSLFKSEHLSAIIKLTFHKALMRSVMTHICPAWELAADTYPLKLQRLQTRFPAPWEIFQGAHQSAICTRLSTFHTHTIIQQNCAGNKQKSYKIMRMNMFTA